MNLLALAARVKLDLKVMFLLPVACRQSGRDWFKDKLLSNLAALVMDEAHLHCDMFGAHTCNFIQCLSQAVWALQHQHGSGALPMMLVSATMGDAKSFAEKLTGETVRGALALTDGYQCKLSRVFNTPIQWFKGYGFPCYPCKRLQLCRSIPSLSLDFHTHFCLQLCCLKGLTRYGYGDDAMAFRTFSELSDCTAAVQYEVRRLGRQTAMPQAGCLVYFMLCYRFKPPC